MREFTCVVCGTKAIDRSTTQNKKFCSKECSDTYWNRARRGGYKGFESCRFNDAISCIESKCDNCGWNPAVARKRKEALK